MKSAFQSRSAELTPQQQVIQVASAQNVHRAFEWFRIQENKLRELQMEVAAIPAPPFGEQKRAEWLSKRFSELELQDVQIDAIGNVTGVRSGSFSDNSRTPECKAVAVTAHLDTVFPEGTNVRPSYDR